MSIYKPCDIRGDATSELTPGLFQCWGRALARMVEPQGGFVVGGDVRRSTPKFLEALVEGLRDGGADVTQVGLVPTPMIYFAKRHLGAEGCAIVTASHNPARINGLKWMVADRPAGPEQVAMLKAAADAQEPATLGPSRGTNQTATVSTEYQAWLSQTWSRTRHPVEFRIVIDPMHGCWADRARQYLQTVFPNARLTAIRDTPDETFGGEMPDCSRPRRLAELGREVRRLGADLGVAFDGDGDRAAFVDNEGAVLSPEEATHVLLHSFGTELAEQPFVCDLKFSDRVAETAELLGAYALPERSGHAFIRARMLQSGALFGAEVSGHYFHRDLEGGDDGLYTACRIIAHMARTRKPLAELRCACPKSFLTSDLRLSVASEEQAQVFDQVRAAWSENPQSTVDGVRVDFPDGWALVRSSVTESALTFRFEADDEPALEGLVRRYCDALPKLGEELWARHQAAARAPEDDSPSAPEPVQAPDGRRPATPTAEAQPAEPRRQPGWPIFEGEKVRLRAYRREDLQQAYALFNHPDVQRGIRTGIPFPYRPEDEQKWFDSLDPNSEKTYGFAIETLEDARYIGGCGINSIDWKNSVAVAGIFLGKSHQGQGYAADAMRVLVRFAFREMNVNKVKLFVHGFNEPAVRCYEKVGFQIEGRLRDEIFRDGRYHDVIVMGLLRSEWEAQNV